MKREIVKYGAKILTEKALPVTEFDEALEQLVADMFETMYDAPGLGWLHPKLGSQTPVCMDCSRRKRQFVFITQRSGTKYSGRG